MSKDNAEQVLLQVQSLLRNSSLRHHESALLAFQLLVWAHLTSKGELEPKQAIDGALQYGASGIVEALSRLALSEGIIGQAFSDAPRRAQFSGDYIVSAVTAAKRLVEGGIFERFDPMEVAAELLQSAPDRLSVPVELASLMVRLTVGDGQLSVYCPWEYSGQFIAALMRDDVRLYAEAPVPSPLPALLSLFREAPTALVLSDPLRSPTAIKGGHLEKFDATLSFPPMGMQSNDEVAWRDLYGRFPIQKATSTGLIVQHVLAQTDGTAAIIVPNSFLFGPGKDREVREYLLDKGCVEAVIALPAGLYRSANVSTALLLLNVKAKHRHVGFVDASQPYFQQSVGKGHVTLANTDAIWVFCRSMREFAGPHGPRGLDESLAVVVPNEEILHNGASLQVDRYVMASEQRDLQARLDTVRTTHLEDVAEIFNPVPNKDRNSDAAAAITVYEVGAADLPQAGYITAPEKTVSIQLSSRRSGSAEDVFLRPGDVLLIVKGSVGKVGIVPDAVPVSGSERWIAGQSSVVLRSRNGRGDLRALGLWLRSADGQQLLAGIKSGATIPMMSIQTLRKFKVPVLTEEWARRAIQVLEQEADIQRQIETLKVEQASLSEQLCADLLN